MLFILGNAFPFVVYFRAQRVFGVFLRFLPASATGAHKFGL